MGVPIKPRCSRKRSFVVIPVAYMLSPLNEIGRRWVAAPWLTAMGAEAVVVYSYTQNNQYLRWPRSYRFRYLDGWREKETRAAMVLKRLRVPTFVRKKA